MSTRISRTCTTDTAMTEPAAVAHCQKGKCLL